MIDLHIDASAFNRTAKHYGTAAKNVDLAQRRAINHTGDKARTQMRRVLVKQTGLKARTITKAVRSTRSSAKGGTRYTIRSRGGDIRLKFFGARETRAGVSAAPWNKRRIYAQTFIKGGKFPNRVALNLNGAVLQRAGSGRYPLRTIKSGLFIPDEMVKGDSAQAFFETVQRDLPARTAHELARIL